KTERAMDLSELSKYVPNPNPLVVEWVRGLEARGKTFEDGVDEILKRAKAIEQGKRQALLTVLRSRGFEVSETDKTRISKSDESMLDRFIARAAKATTLEKVLAEPQRRRPRRRSSSPAMCRVIPAVNPLSLAGETHSCA